MWAIIGLRYTLHPTKSCVLHINQSGDDSLSQFHLCGEQMNTVDEVTHLGITRRSDRRLMHLVEERVKRDRRTAYALFGAGIHGSNGIGTDRSLLIYHSYVYPVFMYGLESMVLDKRSIDTLAAFHMSIIVELQGLPTRCANAAVSHGEPATASCSATHCDPDTFCAILPSAKTIAWTSYSSANVL